MTVSETCDHLIVCINQTIIFLQSMTGNFSKFSQGAQKKHIKLLKLEKLCTIFDLYCALQNFLQIEFEGPQLQWVCNFFLSSVYNEPGIFFAFCTNRLRREISTPKASHDSFAVMNKGKRPRRELSGHSVQTLEATLDYLINIFIQQEYFSRCLLKY